MRVVILAVGSRGDVEPFVALAGRLLRVGHQVVPATHGDLAALAERYGVPAAELPGDPRQLLGTSAGQLMSGARTPVGLVRGLRGMLDAGVTDAYPAALRAAAGADVVVFSSLALVGLNVADRLGVPAVSAHLQPAQSTRAFPTPTLPSGHQPPGVLNPVTWWLTDTFVWRAFLPALNAQRRTLSLSELPARPPSRWTPTVRPTGLFGYSAAVVPVPGDWSGDVHVTGYWFCDPPPSWTPAPDLVDFLGAGTPPVYLGFGSMLGGDPGAIGCVLVEAARRVGRRAVLSAGWAGLAAPAARDVITVGDVPHSWLFPRTAAVVHHGGAGTTAAALRAGVPSVVVPHMVDQFFWAHRLHLLGAAPAPLPRRRLGVGVLAERLEEALRPAPVQAARALAEQLRAEDGLAAAVRVIERAAQV